MKPTHSLVKQWRSQMAKDTKRLIRRSAATGEILSEEEFAKLPKEETFTQVRDSLDDALLNRLRTKVTQVAAAFDKMQSALVELQSDVDKLIRATEDDDRG